VSDENKPLVLQLSDLLHHPLRRGRQIVAGPPPHQMFRPEALIDLRDIG
jgi:hypothetical protein